MILSPHFYGGVFPWAAAVIAAMCLASLALGLLARGRTAAESPGWLLGAMVLAWAWTCLQCVPLPRWLAGELRLESVDKARLLEPVVDFSIPLTVSVDPGATRTQVVVGVAILCAFLSARLLEPRYPGTTARAVVVSVILVGLSGLTHAMAGADSVYGLYEPRFTNSRLLSPIMNNNHMSGFLVMGTLVAIGLAVDGRDRRGPSSWLAAAAFCALLVPWGLSRGALGALVFGIGFWIWALRRRQTEKDRTPASALAVAVAAVAGAAIFVALEPLLRRFEQQDFSKIAMALEGLRLLDGSSWWLGVGRGAFSSAFAAMEGSRLRITHPENILVQWSTEWGVPTATLLVAVLAVVAWRRFRSIRTATSLGLFVGLLALALQNLVDFSLEIPAIAVVASAALGALTAPKGTVPDPRAPPFPRSGLWMLAGALALVASIVAPRIVGRDTQSQADRLVRTMERGDETAFERTLEQALKDHPSEPVFPLLAATQAVRTRDPKAPQWLSIVMNQAPGWGSPHVLAAQWLHGLGRVDQALLEVRQAELRTPGAGLSVLCSILPGQTDLGRLERAAPDVSDVEFYDRAMRCQGLTEALREAIDERILSLAPTHALATVRQAKRSMRKGAPESAIGLLEETLEAHPSEARLWDTLALAHLAAEAPREALAALDRAAEHGIDDDGLLGTRARIHAALGDRDSMTTALARLRGLAGGDSRKVAASFVLQGDLEASMDEIQRALEAYRAADRADPSSSGLYKAAALAARAGLRTEAYDAYRELCMRDAGGIACQRRDELARHLGMQQPVE